MEDVHTLISEWQVGEARTTLQPLLNASPSDIELRFAHGRLLLGRYRESLDVLDAVKGDLGTRLPTALRVFMVASEIPMRLFVHSSEHLTDDGRFLIRYSGRDKAILPYIVDVLVATDKALAKDFRPSERILVEIYPEKITFLAKVSPSLKKISKRAEQSLSVNIIDSCLPLHGYEGYGWRDTVAHEFVHYYVTKVSKNTVPIWLHEGIAKFQERSRWRSARCGN